MFEEQVKAYDFGFREIFRVMVPGVWFVIVFSPTVSKPIWALLAKAGVNFPSGLDNMKLIAAVWVTGFLWFSLQIPKRTKSYRRFVSHLRKFMMELRNTGKVLVDKPVYDYYLATLLPATATVRVHYFASMYYMLMDVAAISFVAVVLNGISLVTEILLKMSTIPLKVIVTSHYADVLILVALASIAIVERIAAMKFLKDVMQFSLFCLLVKKNEVQSLVKIAQESAALERMGRD